MPKRWVAFIAGSIVATTLTAAGLAPLEAEDLALALRVPSVEAIQCVVSGR